MWKNESKATENVFIQQIPTEHITPYQTVREGKDTDIYWLSQTLC